MKLTAKAIEEIKGNKRLRGLLALALDRTDYTILRWLKPGEDSDDLTKATAIEIIKKETGMSESEILEEEQESIEGRK